MKRIAAAIAVSIISLASVFAVEVYEKELKSVADQNIVFQNYTGPHARVDTLNQIKGIGIDLGKTIASKLEQNSTAGSTAKYYVIHAIDPSQKDKLDADILVLGANAGVDHIRNLRHIIASYLVEAYGYSENDAETIAVFITVYNAVYRGKMDVFKAKYKDIVTSNLTEKKAGLSVNYAEWPGNSQIVIPVADINGGLSSVDTSIISDKNVVSSMQDDEGKNIDARKDMVDIKEREAEQASESAQQAQKEAVQEEKKLKEEEKKLEEKKQDVAQAEKDAEKAKADAEKAKADAEKAKQAAAENPQDKKAAAEAKQAEKKADEAEKKADEAEKKVEEAKKEEQQQEKVVEEQQEKTDEAKKEAAEEQAKADKKQNEAQEERVEIAKDQQQVAAEKRKIDTSGSAYGIRLVDSKALLSAMVRLNAKTGALIKESPVKVIRNRIVYEASDGYVAIAGQNTGNGTVKLVLLDKDSLEIVKESEEQIAERSVLLRDNDVYYCILQDGGKFYVARYDENLALQVKSSIEVDEATPVVITGSGIMVTDKSGAAVLLKVEDLTAGL